MSDLQVVAVITARPGSEAVVRSALATLASASRDERGCAGYELFESAAAPGAFITIERWGSQEDLDAHMQTEHVGAAFAAAGEHLASAPVIHPLQPVAD